MAAVPPDESTTFGSFRSGVNPDELARFLAGMHAVPAVRRIKQRSFELGGIGAGTRVLDVGCGVGVDLPELAALVGPAGRVVGLEPNPELASQAAVAAPTVEVVVATAESLPFDEGAFDLVRADRVIHYFSSPVHGLASLARAVSPGGSLVITECLVDLGGAEPDAELLAHVQHRTAGPETGAAGLGLFLPVLLTRAGLRDVELDWQEEVVTAPEDVARCMNLDWALADVTDTNRAERWRGALEEDLLAGRRRLTMRAAHARARVQ